MLGERCRSLELRLCLCPAISFSLLSSSLGVSTLPKTGRTVQEGRRVEKVIFLGLRLQNWENKTKSPQGWMQPGIGICGSGSGFQLQPSSELLSPLCGRRFPLCDLGGLSLSASSDTRSRVPWRRVICGPTAGPWYTQKGNGVLRPEPPEALREGQMAAAGSSDRGPRSAAKGH